MVSVAILAWLAGLFTVSFAAVGEEVYIAGTEPDRRPQGAPVIAEFNKSDAWYTNALRGVQLPYPYSLRFLEYQGAWYTPFNRPGLTGRYDIRGLHARPPR